MNGVPGLAGVRAVATRGLLDALLAVAGAALLITVSTCSHSEVVALDLGEGDIVIPDPAGWIDRGEILQEGAEGEWDRYLWGGFTASAVTRAGVLYLYYQGADGFDDAEGTVTFRAIGVATSTDGTTFIKHPANPVISWWPTDDLEEGAVSGGAFLTPQGDVGLYYGANTHAGGERVSANGRYAVSSDGSSFEDRGIALDREAPDLWAGGDEIFPVIAFEHEGRTVVYYIPNGVLQTGQLGVAYGPGPRSLVSSAGVRSAGRDVPAWGPGAAVRLGPARYAVFVTVRGDRHDEAVHIDAYLVDPDDPAAFSDLVTTYVLPNMTGGTVLLDEASGTWYLIHRDADARAYRLRTAAIERNRSP